MTKKPNPYINPLHPQAKRNQLENYRLRRQPKRPDGWWLKYDHKYGSGRYARYVNVRLDRRAIRRVKNGWHC